jgi:UDP-N-acetylglucosamine transferase subunit ALG13
MPDLIVIDHAPTALISLRGTPVKTVLYGTGYFSPPKLSPMPSLMPWVQAPEGLMESSETKAVKVINKALSQLQAPPLQKLSDLFAVDEDFLITFKELDHYEIREPARYWGPVLDLPEGLNPSWPDRFTKKIFCYLKHDNPHFENLLYALKRIKAAIIIYAPGTSEKLMQETQTPNITFVQEHVNMHNVCDECDLVICQAGIGTVVTSLLYGKPLLVIPGHNHLEQVLTARNVIRLKAGLAILKQSQEVQAVNGYQAAVLRLLNEPQFHEQAASFAEKYKDFDPDTQMSQIADRCEEIMNKGK